MKFDFCFMQSKLFMYLINVSQNEIHTITSGVNYQQQTSNFTEICSVVLDMKHVDGRTDITLYVCSFHAFCARNT
jgi:hypothetical protein